MAADHIELELATGVIVTLSIDFYLLLIANSRALLLQSVPLATVVGSVSRLA